MQWAVGSWAEDTGGWAMSRQPIRLQKSSGEKLNKSYTENNPNCGIKI
jgi:hypothetical protein